jgi:mRNA interferase RelE/StbE
MNTKYTVQLKKKASKQLESLSKRSIYLRLRKAIDALAENPRPSGCKKMKTQQEQYRIRVGEFRIIYDVDDGVRIIDIVKLGDRKEVYRD